MSRAVDQATPAPEVVSSLLWGLVTAGVLIAGIVLGSRGFKDFDPALVPYAGASVFSAFGIGYRYSMWLRRPPTRRYWLRGWQLFFASRQLPGNIFLLVRLFWDNFVAQKFIDRRSHTRWAAHWFIAWGCLLAASITFPLSFGWIRFETARNSQQIYECFVFGIRLFAFPLGGVVAFLIFNVLNVAAVMVLFGVFMALWRRASDSGEIALQQFTNDLLPLILLFSVAVTGLLLTASSHFLRGFHYVFLSQFHAVSVILTLIYLPFGKFFHIFQRPAQLGVSFYRKAGAAGEQAVCMRCGEAYGSQLHMADLKQVEAALGIRYQMPGGAHYQDVCPSCRRKSLALTQDALWRVERVDGE